MPDQQLEQQTILQAGPKNPWDRLPGEPPDWHARFVMHYLNAGPGRTMTKAWRAFSSPEKPISGGFKRIFVKWRWEERAFLYDISKANEVRQRLEEQEGDLASDVVQTLRKLNRRVNKILDIEDIQELRRAAGSIASMHATAGKGEAIKRLIDGYRSIYGETHNIRSASVAVVQFRDLDDSAPGGNGGN